MFLFRWIKKLIVLAISIICIIIIANYNWHGKPIKQHAMEFFKSSLFKDGVKDIKLMVGELLSSVGSGIKEDITKEDKEELEKVINKELKK